MADDINLFWPCAAMRDWIFQSKYTWCQGYEAEPQSASASAISEKKKKKKNTEAV